MIIQWDSAYLSTPSNTLIRSLIDDEIRQVIYSVRERMATEHRFGPLTSPPDDPDDLDYKTYHLTQGYHLPGGTTICDVGNTAARDAVVTPQLGALFVVQDGSDYSVNIYTATGWQSLSTIDHLALTGTADDDHPQYVLKSGGNMTGSLDMGGNVIVTQGTGDTFGQFTLYGHRTSTHDYVENIAAITNNAVTAAKLSIQQQEITTTLAPDSSYTFTNSFLGFVPQVYIYTNDTSYTSYILMGANYLVYNANPLIHPTFNIRIRREWIA